MTELEAQTLCVDIDLTLCISQGDYASAEPIPGAREALQALGKDGWKVVLFTARHFNHWQVTVDWLKRFGFEYDQIVFGKPPARYYIDDRAIPFNGSWEEVQGYLKKVDPKTIP
jgi:ribonucleotide monophosphatase NagD (HAD superfamily)